MTRSLLVLVVALTTATAFGCTSRYSQSLAGAIPQAEGSRVESSDSGFSFLGITFDEPRSAHDQVTSLLGECSTLNKVEVDYREMFFLIFGVPRVAVKADCTQ